MGTLSGGSGRALGSARLSTRATAAQAWSRAAAIKLQVLRRCTNTTCHRRHRSCSGVSAYRALYPACSDDAYTTCMSAPGCRKTLSVMRAHES
jgi:hypothetical protein